MFSAGLVDEVRRLTRDGQGLGRTARQAVGYAEALDHLAGRCRLCEAIEQARKRTRRLAKRQGTWFRSLKECRPLALDEDTSPADAAARIVDLARSES
jgi:tRNA dimethylallyltransferase